jgi:hypothetical protein
MDYRPARRRPTCNGVLLAAIEAAGGDAEIAWFDAMPERPKTCTTAYYRVLIRCLNECCVVWRFTAALAAGAAGIELRGWLRQASA